MQGYRSGDSPLILEIAGVIWSAFNDLVGSSSFRHFGRFSQQIYWSQFIKLYNLAEKTIAIYCAVGDESTKMRSLSGT